MLYTAGAAARRYGRGAIPRDPYDGGPVKFATRGDGIAVYTTGSPDALDRNKKRLINPLGGTEVGWQLYDPPHRGLPPLPPKEVPNDEP